MLAKNLRAPLAGWLPALSVTIFASKLAPTESVRMNWFFAQNIDPERYPHRPNRVKEPLRQLSDTQASNGNFPRHMRNTRLNPAQTIFIIIWRLKTSLQLKQNIFDEKPANAHTTRATAPRRCTMCLFHRIISPWEFYLPGV